ncbi:MAG: histidinol-phosphate transaminase [Helicobacter sp.]|uniref:histidinol-phosphate transaminase n=1 Tax=Helicobacter sp. 10-6591 TaxID=2004998 RepID=UPI000DCE523D|nr:histidinol-phosphate transaminase [Helicobacter sp. 10-6591]MDD7568245.1 histidinol-phosphate transaminase [Helicobacter sp.]MDY5740481.1 histidinol-phosphate transaminase [Helicobacter sp.]RAX56328.1 histidinol-phosphate transaminase [Helicobacter sp. 10-6591]
MHFNPYLQDINSYQAGRPIEEVMREYGIAREDIIKLASNENPYGAAPEVLESLKENIHTANLYPDDSYYQLKSALAQKFNTESSNIIIGSGSDQIIEFCIHVCAETNREFKILQAGVTFAMYEIYAKLFGAKVLKTKSAAHDLEQFLEISKKEQPAIIFLCAPNNPLGECLESKEIEQFLGQISHDTLVVLDGAYQEYAAFKDESKALNPQRLLHKFQNMIYLGTFSKAYGLGGMRVGYGIASQEIIKMLHKVRPPFNITTLSLCAAFTALKYQDFTQQCIEKNFSEMRIYEDFFTQYNIGFIPSWTNFLTIKDSKIDSTQLCEWFLQKGIILRDLKSYGLNACRITVGTNEQNQKVLKLFKEFLDSMK